jgi:hypothetical protein
MIDPKKLPAFVRNDVIESLIANNHTVADAAAAEVVLSQMSAREVFDIYLNWIGLYGYTDKLMDAVDGIRAASIK